jgi:hypothetical protein
VVEKQEANLLIAGVLDQLLYGVTNVVKLALFTIYA